MKVSDKKIVSSVTELLENLSKRHGFTLLDDNFDDTPNRVARAYDELLSGYDEDIRKILSKSFSGSNYDQMIVVKDISYHSLCAHHMLPFYGKIAVGYIPGKEGRVIGLSKVARVCHAFARRFQIQERMTAEIANAINVFLEPSGVGVMVYDSIHMCMHMRGVKESHSTMETTALFGEFRTDPAVRKEFFDTVKR